MSKPFCVIPFTKAFVWSDGTYKDCCTTNPAVISRVDDTFDSWWHGESLSNVRNSMQNDKDHPRCNTCTTQERIHNSSFRLAVNRETTDVTDNIYPRGWHVMLGNICNLACWSCSENFSSTIVQQKKQINALPENFVDPQQSFSAKWPDLKENILKSYDIHPVITICLLGGEPVYNKDALQFIEHLVDSGLSHATRLEITTNGTIINNKLIALLNKSNWHHISIFVSVDAIGPKAEWLRYGSKWNVVKQNIDYYRTIVNYLEIHTVVSILNINDLPMMENFCQEQKLPHNIGLVTNPDYLDIRNWDGDLSMVDYNSQYVDMIGSTKKVGTRQTLKNYIQQFTNRKPLTDVDPVLAIAIGL
jgi:sulfatase maturation enzyme AslB (radical SAM superfamily)